MKYHDLTLRDGSHAISHKLSLETVENHCKFAEKAGIEVVEVGHGNGLGASSIIIGESLASDFEMVQTARRHLKKTKISVHVIPGVATIKRDIDPILDMVDIFRVASHCTEATMTKTHIEYLAAKGKTVYGVLMMAALCSTTVLVEEALKMKSYGASAVIIMDSSGSFVPEDVTERINALNVLNVPIGFHGHNNMHLAVANSLAAIRSGASIIDVTVKGFGAGAGNTPLEVMEAVHPTNLDIEFVHKYADAFPYDRPITKLVNILTAKHKLFSGFEKCILNMSEQYNVPLVKLVQEISNHNLVAGQDDIIRVIAARLGA
jgi:4-hydroxy 2-oxovalerate aldolase